MVKVLSAKVKDEVYEQFVKKAQDQGINQSEYLRNLIMKELNAYVEKPMDRIMILQESIKILNDVKLMMANIVSSEKPKIMEYLERQIGDFEKKLDFEKKRR
jgi:hypothetical protein